MRIAPIVIKLRSANTRFGDNIGSAAELELVKSAAAITKDIAFVIPLDDVVESNAKDGTIRQIIREKFSIVTIFANDDSQKAKYGMLAYDKIHDTRSELFRAIVGHQFVGAEGMIEYSGGQLLPLNPAYLWYQFDFQFNVTLREYDGYYDIDNTDILRDWNQESQISDLTKIWTDYILSPDESIPYSGDLPVNASLVDMSQLITTADDRNPGNYGRGFGSDFDFYRILNRRNDPK